MLHMLPISAYLFEVISTCFCLHRPRVMTVYFVGTADAVLASLDEEDDDELRLSLFDDILEF